MRILLKIIKKIVAFSPKSIYDSLLEGDSQKHIKHNKVKFNKFNNCHNFDWKVIFHSLLFVVVFTQFCCTIKFSSPLAEIAAMRVESIIRCCALFVIMAFNQHSTNTDLIQISLSWRWWCNINNGRIMEMLVLGGWQHFH